MAKLEVGDPAPNFSATTSAGKTVCLSDYLQKKWLVIFFYPKNGTPICTKEACAIRDSSEKFIEAGAEVLGVSSDTDESHRDFAVQHQLSYPLISDADGSLRKAFSVPKSFGFLPGRVTYVIDKQGIIQLIYSAQFASEQHVQAALASVSQEAKKTR